MKTAEATDIDRFVREQAMYAQQLQKTVTDGQELEKWVEDGNLKFIEDRVFKKIERATFDTLKNPAFDPANVSQVAQLKALCQTMDLIRTDINSQVWAVKDARTKLNDLQNSTIKDDHE